MTRSTRTPKSRPVIARRAPIGHARTRTGAIRLAYRFASAADRALFDAGYHLACWESSSRFHVTLAK